jgi:hypothetical protein
MCVSAYCPHTGICVSSYCYIVYSRMSTYIYENECGLDIDRAVYQRVALDIYSSMRTHI